MIVLDHPTERRGTNPFFAAGGAASCSGRSNIPHREACTGAVRDVRGGGGAHIRRFRFVIDTLMHPASKRNTPRSYTASRIGYERTVGNTSAAAHGPASRACSSFQGERLEHLEDLIFPVELRAHLLGLLEHLHALLELLELLILWRARLGRWRRRRASRGTPGGGLRVAVTLWLRAGGRHLLLEALERVLRFLAVLPHLPRCHAWGSGRRRRAAAEWRRGGGGAAAGRRRTRGLGGVAAESQGWGRGRGAAPARTGTRQAP